MVFAKLNPNFEYLPPYDSLIWDYKNASVQLNNSAIENFDYVKSFEDKKCLIILN